MSLLNRSCLISAPRLRNATLFESFGDVGSLPLGIFTLGLHLSQMKT